MLREWVLARLDAETREVPATEAHSGWPTKSWDAEEKLRDVRSGAARIRGVETATAALADVTVKLADVAALLTEVTAAQGATTAQPPAGRWGLSPRMAHVAEAPTSRHMPMISAGPNRSMAATFQGNWPMWMEFSTSTTYRYVDRGLAELRSTVEAFSDRHHIGGEDLGGLYATVDEELATP